MLLGRTRGYRNYPQLDRFRNIRNPVGVIATYLRAVFDEAKKRGYHFNADKIANRRARGTMAVTSGQVAYERRHLLEKLRTRDAEACRRLERAARIGLHPPFRKVAGDVEAWEVRR